jgi:hypothetical protein
LETKNYFTACTNQIEESPIGGFAGVAEVMLKEKETFQDFGKV